MRQIVWRTRTAGARTRWGNSQRSPDPVVILRGSLRGKKGRGERGSSRRL